MSHSIFDIRRHPLVFCLCIGRLRPPPAWSAERARRSRNQPGVAKSLLRKGHAGQSMVEALRTWKQPSNQGSADDLR